MIALIIVVCWLLIAVAFLALARAAALGDRAMEPHHRARRRLALVQSSEHAAPEGAPRRRSVALAEARRAEAEKAGVAAARTSHTAV